MAGSHHLSVHCCSSSNNSCQIAGIYGLKQER